MSSNAATGINESAGAWLFAAPLALLLAIAISLVILGSIVLWLGWRNPQSSIGQSLVSWLIISLSVPFWLAAFGPEFGVTFFAISLSFVAWLIIGKNLDAKPLKLIPQAKEVNGGNGKRLIISLQVINVVFLCPLVSLGLMMSLEFLSPFALAGTLVFEAIVYPILWAVLAIAVIASKQTKQITAIFFILSLCLLWVLFG